MLNRPPYYKRPLDEFPCSVRKSLRTGGLTPRMPLSSQPMLIYLLCHTCSCFVLITFLVIGFAFSEFPSLSILVSDTLPLSTCAHSLLPSRLQCWLPRPDCICTDLPAVAFPANLTFWLYMHPKVNERTRSLQGSSCAKWTEQQAQEQMPAPPRKKMLCSL